VEATMAAVATTRAATRVVTKRAPSNSVQFCWACMIPLVGYSRSAPYR